MRWAGLDKLSLSDFPGCVAAVAFTRGCNFDCPYCHNREIIERDNEVVDRSAEILGFLDRRGAFLDGLVITGGEPCIQNGLQEFCAEIKRKGLKIKLDTNGSRPDVLGKLLTDHLLDYVAMDLKAPFHRYDALCGRPVDTSSVRRSVEILDESGVECELRTTCVPGLLGEEDMMAMGGVVRGRVPWYLQRFVDPGWPVPGADESAALDLDALGAALDERYGNTHVRK